MGLSLEWRIRSPEKKYIAQFSLLQNEQSNGNNIPNGDSVPLSMFWRTVYYVHQSVNMAPFLMSFLSWILWNYSCVRELLQTFFLIKILPEQWWVNSYNFFISKFSMDWRNLLQKRPTYWRGFVKFCAFLDPVMSYLNISAVYCMTLKVGKAFFHNSLLQSRLPIKWW
jgi:hypothetical protein